MNKISTKSKFSLAGHARLKKDAIRGTTFLLLPERAVKLNETAATILNLCDGSITMEEIKERLKDKYQNQEVDQDLVEFLDDMVSKGWLEIVGEKV